METIYGSITEIIGKTPLVRVNRIGAEYSSELLAKCEFLSPGGSVKDRVGLRMLQEAERSGRIKPGDTIVEPTSGNTGIGLAMAGTAKGYRVIIVMPEKMSMEKQVTLEALGAQIVRTPTGAAYDSPESNFSVARQIAASIPNAHILDQFGNPDNPAVHEEETAMEILEQTGGNFDYFISSVGTGGTITGCARAFRKHVPNVKIIGVDPVGSILGGGEAGAPYLVEGIGYDFIPDVLDNSLVDEYIKTEDGPSFEMARRIIREEGMLVGGSCGATLWAALKIAERHTDPVRIVMIFPDNVRNYMSKFIDDRWLIEKGFVPPPKPNFVNWELLKESA
ncbi:MAG: putative cystathionine beta-synthase [Fimbriimonadaceae bacterium]|nr:putative cystathionine beta-synthase [Fimbriimonadaceae bacterium]